MRCTQYVATGSARFLICVTDGATAPVTGCERVGGKWVVTVRTVPDVVGTSDFAGFFGEV